MTIPNFIIGGVPKAGTTSLDSYIRRHPDVYCAKKEPRYFLYDANNEKHRTERSDHFWVRTKADYLALFDGVTTESAIGECTPFYMLSPVAQRRIPEELPDVRLIFSLREPVARAYSAYWMMVRLGRETRSMEGALAEGTSYTRSGLYAAHLVKWYERFNQTQIKVTLFDDLKEKPLVVFQDICRFLGVRDDFVPEIKVVNKGHKPKYLALARMYARLASNSSIKAIYPRLPSSIQSMVLRVRGAIYEAIPPLPQELRRRLSAYYRDDIAELEALLGRDLSIWTTVSGPDPRSMP